MINAAWINYVRTRYNSLCGSILNHPYTIEDDPNNNNYPKNWSAIQEIIFFNLRDELLNAHYSFHHQSRLEHDYGLNEMAFYF